MKIMQTSWQEQHIAAFGLIGGNTSSQTWQIVQVAHAYDAQNTVPPSSKMHINSAIPVERCIS